MVLIFDCERVHARFISCDHESLQVTAAVFFRVVLPIKDPQRHRFSEFHYRRQDDVDGGGTVYRV